MNTNNLKKYAPTARNEFIAAVTQRAALFGIEGDDKISDVQVAGSVMLINGNSFDAAMQGKQQRLVNRVKVVGFNQLMEQVAYTWFNRLCAIRYMELHDYLGHGLRVLSSSPSQGESRDEGATPELLTHAQDVAEELGLDRNQIIELKLAGNKEEELYRELLLGQCHQLYKAMPFLFEALDDETELLLPDNLTRTDSILRELVTTIPEEDWANIEIIGWLYQFYISEKKGEVIGKVVKSEDIPAATQLFTPNWIVKYMVQNSLGAQWLATYPDSPIKGEMEYYIEPAEQTDEVNAQLAAITPDALNPEELTLIDPACGSGHILVEAYDLFKAIYLERGYRRRDVAQLIIEKNLFGLDIDGRAAQLTGFALMMKGRADDRRLFERGVKLNVMALVDSAGFDADVVANGIKLDQYGLKAGDLIELKRLFEHATDFGSLIEVPETLTKKLPSLKILTDVSSSDLFVANELNTLRPLVQQASILGGQYHSVAANPPYMGSAGMNAIVKKFVNSQFPDSKSDLFSCFMERAMSLVANNGRYGFITMPSWLFLTSFEKLREKLLDFNRVISLLHMGRGIFGIDFGSVAFVMQKLRLKSSVGRYFRLHKRNFQHIHIPDIAQLLLNSLRDESFKYDFDAYRGAELGTRIPLESMTAGDLIHYTARQEGFKKIPGSPIAYWVTAQIREMFENNPSIGSVFSSRDGLTTGDNDRFLRRWHEVRRDQIGLGFSTRELANKSGRRWFPCNKGGPFRRWYGNNEFLILWEEDGSAIRSFTDSKGKRLSTPRNMDYYFRESATWSDVSSSFLSVRWSDEGAIFETAGPAVFAGESTHAVLAFLCTSIAASLIKMINPTLHCKPGNIAVLPWKDNLALTRINLLAKKLVASARIDWDSYERSWDFQSLPILTASSEPTPTLESSYTAWTLKNRDTVAEMKRLEEENNRLFIDAYGLQDELTPDVPIEQITLTVNPAYRYGGKLSKEQQWARFRVDTMAELVSYAIGCMMGRYSLDETGLIYAHSGNEDFDTSRYTTFPADDDGIIPLTDTEWFSDDAANRLIKFISVAWDKSHLEDNLAFLADNLAPRKNETNRDTIRRYLCTTFFKDHLKSYKKRPIYWLFSSGRQKAFQCLVYLHRYNEGTLARMRTEYVTPLLGKYDTYADQLQHQVDDASSTAAANRFKKELIALEKKQTELQGFDDKLKHYADRRIKLDLDDGVKANYGKFGDLLADVKAITGKKPEVN